MTGLRPCVSNSFWQKARAKYPRLSSRRSISMMKAPFSFVSVNIIKIKSDQQRRTRAFTIDGPCRDAMAKNYQNTTFKRDMKGAKKQRWEKNLKLFMASRFCN